MIKTRTRSEGKKVVREGGNEVKLPSLKASTIKVRERLDRKGRLHPETTPSTSNLTRSGKMLDSMVYKTSYSGKGIKLTFTFDANEINKQAEELEKLGFSFLYLSKKELQEVDDLVAKLVAEEIYNIKL